MKNVSASSYGKDVDIMNEDGELAVAYQTQKDVNRLVTKLIDNCRISDLITVVY